MRFLWLLLLLCSSCTMAVAPLDDSEALDGVSLALAVYEHEYGPSRDFPMFEAELGEPNIGLCDETDVTRDRVLILDVGRIRDGHYVAEKFFDTALHEIVHINESCSAKDHGNRFVMEDTSSDWHYHAVRKIMRRCAGDVPCLADEMFSEEK